MSLATAALTASAIAQPSSPFNTEECLRRTALRWCQSKATEQGWKKQYESKSPSDLMDVAWLIEVWVRGHDAFLCERRWGRAGERMNACRSLSEVVQ